MLDPALEQAAEALERQDYRAAAQLLKPLVKRSPKDPWVQFYTARVYEGVGQSEKAEQLYRRLLKSATQQKLIKEARQGLKRIEEGELAQRQTAIAQATVQEGQTALGGLILEPLLPAQKQKVVPAFARMMRLDEYVARLLLPSRGWRFYRTGKIGELEVYANQLQTIGVPAFCMALEELETVPVFQAKQLQFKGDRILSVSINESEALVQFSAKQVRACLEGALPMLESVVDVNKLKKNPFIRKRQVKDYAKVLDLHLPGQIVRLCDRTYRFERGNSVEDRYTSIPQRWRQLLRQLSEQCHPVVGSEQFQNFANTVLDQEDFLHHIEPNLELSQADALIFHDDVPPWHEAFHLYSTLRFRRYPR